MKSKCDAFGFFLGLLQSRIWKYILQWLSIPNSFRLKHNFSKYFINQTHNTIKINNKCFQYANISVDVMKTDKFIETWLLIEWQPISLQAETIFTSSDLIMCVTCNVW